MPVATMEVRVHPRARRNDVIALDCAIKVYVTAAPEGRKGKRSRTSTPRTQIGSPEAGGRDRLRGTVEIQGPVNRRSRSG